MGVSSKLRVRPMHPLPDDHKFTECSIAQELQADVMDCFVKFSRYRLSVTRLYPLLIQAKQCADWGVRLSAFCNYASTIFTDYGVQTPATHCSEYLLVTAAWQRSWGVGVTRCMAYFGLSKRRYLRLVRHKRQGKYLLLPLRQNLKSLHIFRNTVKLSTIKVQFKSKLRRLLLFYWILKGIVNARFQLSHIQLFL